MVTSQVRRCKPGTGALTSSAFGRGLFRQTNGEVMPSVIGAPARVSCWMSVARRSVAQPPRLRVLSRDNHLITRTYVSAGDRETSGRNGPIGWAGRMLRLD